MPRITGRPPIYNTPEERAEASRLSAQRYRQKRQKELDDAKAEIADLKQQIMILKDALAVIERVTEELPYVHFGGALIGED
jgi:hypothetical protein